MKMKALKIICGLAASLACFSAPAFAADSDIIGVENAVLDPGAQCAAAHHPQIFHEGRHQPRSPRSHQKARRRRAICFLDFRRRCPRQFHPHPRRRRSRVPSEQPSGQQNAAQHRPARGHRSRRRRGFLVHRAGTLLAIFLQGAQSRLVHLSLRDRSGRHARGQRHVWHDPRRAEGRLAARGP